MFFILGESSKILVFISFHIAFLNVSDWHKRGQLLKPATNEEAWVVCSLEIEQKILELERTVNVGEALALDPAAAQREREI